jgi:hypothetical protein
MMVNPLLEKNIGPIENRHQLKATGSFLCALIFAAIVTFTACSSSGQAPESQVDKNPGQIEQIQPGQSLPGQALPGQTSTNPSQSGFSNFGDEALIQAQTAHAIKVEVEAVAKVKKLLSEDDQGLPHQKFLLVLSNGTTVLIAHNIKIADRVPVSAGDTVKVHGEYIWNPRGGLIHWTHRSDTPYHEGGWIELNGVRYQ